MNEAPDRETTMSQQYLIASPNGPVFVGRLEPTEQRCHWPAFAIPYRIIRWRVATDAVRLSDRTFQARRDLFRAAASRGVKPVGSLVQTAPDTLDGYLADGNGLMDYRAIPVSEAEVAALVAAERESQSSRTLPEPETLLCDCGHECERVLVMSASLGTACPECYDRMSD